MEILVLLGLLFLMIFIGIPVAFAIGLTSISYMLLFDVSNLIELPTKIFTSNDSYVFLAIPLFLFSGYIMESGRISERLVDFIYKLLGKIPGSLGSVAVFACMIFAALTGSAVATIAAIGTVMSPKLVERGYPKAYSAGIIAAAGSLGPIIPPSIPMVIYGSTMGVSVADMFKGGIIPGLAIGLGLVLANTIYSIKKHIPVSEEPFDIKSLAVSFSKSIGILFLPVLIMGGIYGGVFTPTEAATLAVIYSFILTVFYKTMSVSKFITACRKTIFTAGAIMTIINISLLFAYILNIEGIPQKIANSITPYLSSSIVYLIVLWLLLIIIGCIMDSGPAIMILAPILAPIGIVMGVDPIFLGVMFCAILCSGAITPPFGIGLFTISGTSGVSFGNVVKGAIGFIVLTFTVLLILLFFPKLVLLFV